MQCVTRCVAPILHHLSVRAGRGKSRSRLIAACEFLMKLPRTPLNIVTAFMVAFLTFFPMMACDQSAPARDYLNTPVNQARFFLDFVGSSGETAAESDLPLPDNESVSRLGSASLLWSFPLGDRYGGVALSGNYATVKVKGPHGSMETSGFGDPSTTFHANIFGAPALTIEQFPHAVPQTYLSFHLTVNARFVRSLFLSERRRPKGGLLRGAAGGAALGAVAGAIAGNAGKGALNGLNRQIEEAE
jgi:hypothetical protein